MVKMDSIEKRANLFSVLADPTRLKLLGMLAQQQEPHALCVNALGYKLGITQSAVSQHLKVLKSAGLVKGERRGYRMHYFIDEKALDQAQQLISGALPIIKVKAERKAENEAE